LGTIYLDYEEEIQKQIYKKAFDKLCLSIDQLNIKDDYKNLVTEKIAQHDKAYSTDLIKYRREDYFSRYLESILANISKHDSKTVSDSMIEKIDSHYLNDIDKVLLKLKHQKQQSYTKAIAFNNYAVESIPIVTSINNTGLDSLSIEYKIVCKELNADNVLITLGNEIFRKDDYPFHYVGTKDNWEWTYETLQKQDPLKILKKQSINVGK